MLYSFRNNLLRIEISACNSLPSSSLRMFSEISSIRIAFSETLQNKIFRDSSDSHYYCSVYLSLTSTLQHWSQNLFFLLFLSVQQRFPDCMLSLISIWRAKSSWETCETEDSNTVGTPNYPVFSLVVFEKSEKLWFGSLMSTVSSSTELFLSNSVGSLPAFASDLAK